ncbi:MAG: hypothetical protein ABL995_09170 [Bryobacteraceae bacterium]
MATLTASPAMSSPPRNRLGHRARVGSAAFAAAVLIAYLALHGYTYYATNLEDRPFSPLHTQLRSSGTIGFRLGILGVCLFGILFLHPIRKRWGWLAQKGSTRHWLDFHAVVGITAPLVITFHSAFKFHGLAGLAYWIMVVVALSGFIGRYVYSQIPRSIHSVELSVDELQEQTSALAARLHEQRYFREEDVSPLLAVPTREEVQRMNLVVLVWTMLMMDLRRPFLVGRLRRRLLHGSELLTTLGGVLDSHHADFESVIQGVRRQSWLRAKTAFLERALQLFHLWHVVHRPFSLSFIVLVIVHLTVVQLVGHR